MTLLYSSEQHISDSILRAADSKWGVFASSFFEYKIEFRQLDADLKIESFLKYLQTKEKPLIIDLMSSNHALRDIKHTLFPDSDFEGLAVSLTDNRGHNERIDDQFSNITHLEGNLNNKDTWINIFKTLKGRKADLIVERGMGGLTNIKHNPAFYRASFNYLLDLINQERGMIILQLPPAMDLIDLGIPILVWLDQLKSYYGNVSYTGRYVSPNHPSGARYSLLLLETNGNPQKPKCLR